jgi:hypothetical protein
LNFSDNAGNTGKLNLERSGKIGMKVNNKDFNLSKDPSLR